MSKEQEYPYRQLGTALRKLRQKQRETVADVSGAVEIEIDMLTAFELGTRRPDKDILLLLISHFGVPENEAAALWETAGYDQRDMNATFTVADDAQNSQTPVVVLPGDARIIYTDLAHIMVNNHGVVLNFMQSAGPSNQPMIVSRLGMSREHAKSVLEMLRRTLAETEQKHLPAPNAADITAPAPEQDTKEADKQA